MDEWHRDHIVPTVDQVLAGLRGRGRANLLTDFAFPIPFMVTSQVIGLEDSAQVVVTRAVNTILNFTVDLNAALEASATLRDAMHDLVVARLAEPRDDLVSTLLASEIDGQRLEPEQVVDLLRLLAGAAMDTTYRSTSVLLYCLLSDLDQLHSVRDDPSLVDGAVEEALRWEAVGPIIPRYAKTDGCIDSVDIPAGSLVLCCATMANRDPARWPDEPTRFKADRSGRTHHTFGGGPHTCLGASLAKQMMTQSLRRLLEEYPDLHFDPDEPMPTMSGLLLRAPTAIPVLLEA
jgi:cytochrome P450